MSLFDWILIIIAIGGAFFGYKRGLIAQIGSLVGLIAAIIFCRIFAGDLAAAFNSPSDTAQTRLLHTVLSYVLIFAVCYIGSRILVSICNFTLSALRLKGIDNLAGAVFKVLEWVLFYSLFLNLWVMVLPETQIRSSRSRLTETVLNFAPNVLGSETASEVFHSVDALGDKARVALPADTTRESTGETVRDAVIERVIGSATGSHGDEH